MRQLKKHKQVKVNAMAYGHLIKAMLDGVYSCEELAEETGLHYATVLQYSRELWLAGAAHICAWEKDAKGREVIKIYKIGEGKDAKRKKLTPAQRQQRYKQKKFNMEMMHRMAA